MIPYTNHDSSEVAVTSVLQIPFSMEVGKIIEPNDSGITPMGMTGDIKLQSDKRYETEIPKIIKDPNQFVCNI